LGEVGAIDLQVQGFRLSSKPSRRRGDKDMRKLFLIGCSVLLLASLSPAKDKLVSQWKSEV
jgi:hypothetical protein